MLKKMDRIDLAILDSLQSDLSRPVTELAESVGISQAPCWRRIKRLKDAGYIKSERALLDRHALGLRTQIFALVKLTAHGRSNLNDFAHAMTSFPEVLDCFVLMGSVDFLIRIVTTDVETYEKFFFERLSQVPGVQEINSMVALSEIKSTTALPLPR